LDRVSNEIIDLRSGSVELEWLVSQNIVPGSFIKRDEVYTFGLFRDVGVPVFLSNFKDYLETLNLATNEVGASLTLIEDREYGVNHAFLGAQLAKEWALPNEYWQAIEFHHDIPALCGTCQVPLADISRYFIAIVQLAEFLHKTVSHKGNTSDWDQFGESCLDQLQITSDGLNKLFVKMTSYKQR
jgi:HD-like signal output (HDOD) protein